MAILTALSGTTYRLIPAHVRKDDEQPLDFQNERDAFQFLIGMSQDEFNAAAIQSFAAEDIPILNMFAVGEPKVLAYIAANIVAGRFHVVRAGAYQLPLATGGRSTEPAEPAEPAEPEEPPPPDEKTWIRFEIRDDETNEPVSGVTLKVILPDGTPANKKSGPDGIIEWTDIDPGTCEIERMLDGDTLEVVSVE